MPVSRIVEHQEPDALGCAGVGAHHGQARGFLGAPSRGGRGSVGDRLAFACPVRYNVVMDKIAAREAARIRKAAYRARYPDRAAAQIKRAHDRRRADVPAFLCAKAKERAARKGVPFDLTPADIVVPASCPVFGVRFGKGGPNAASLDRIIPALGYVPGNVRVMSHRANRLISDGTAEEHQAIVAFLTRQRPG